MGGINDPEKGAMMYERRTEVTVEQSETGEKKRVKKIVEQTSWIGRDKPKKKTKQFDPLEEDDDDEPLPPKPEETNPLYSPTEYVSDFSNPIYSGQTMDSSAVLGTESVEFDDQAPLTVNADFDPDKEVEMGEADTLF